MPELLLQLAIVEVTATGDIEYVKTMLPLFEDVGRTGTPGTLSEAVWASWHITGILERASQRDPEAAKVFAKFVIHCSNRPMAPVPATPWRP